MSNKPNDIENMYDWMMHSDANDARLATIVCECGSEKTYKDKKGYDTTYLHSWWCPKYKDKPKNDDKQKEK